MKDTKDVSARVGTKFNSYREPHNDAHYLFARYKMRRELDSLFQDDILIVSVDDMAKIKVGAPAVSRYYQVKRIFSRDDNPNLPDHDFPVPGYHLTVSGYMFLENSTDKNENSNLNNASTYDATGEVCAVQDFDRMEVEGSPCSILELVARQAYLHHNVEVI